MPFKYAILPPFERSFILSLTCLISDFVAAKIRGRVKDQKIANMLIPTDHGFGTRRVPQESYYYEVFNQSNVKLVSMLESPIKCITPTGLKTNETEF